MTNLESGGSYRTDPGPIDVLENVRRHGRAWKDLAAQYGVTNPDPPWRITLEVTCEMLAVNSCAKSDPIEANSCSLPALERRAEEDDLSATLYADVPFPERQLLALAHSMIRRGLIDKEQLAQRMKEVYERLSNV